jgi:uncharacterized protein (TIGR02678 family)
MEKSISFSETTKECIEYLFEYFFVDRKKHRDIYFQICHEQRKIKHFFKEYFQYSLIIHPDFAKLEKVTTTPKSWMGIERFKEPKDYVILSCFMAFLEQQIADEFVLGEVTDAVKHYYPGQGGIQWVGHGGYYNRLSLIRVVRTLEELGILVILDRDIEQFKEYDDYQVLFKKQSQGRYFMRNLPFDLTAYTSVAILNHQQDKEKELSCIGMKQELMRRLWLEPYLRKSDMGDGLYEYLSRNLEQTEHILEQTSHYQVEAFKTGTMLTRSDTYSHLTTFPDLKMKSQLTMQLSSYLLELISQKKLHKTLEGETHVTRSEFIQLVEILKERNGEDWTASFRQMSSQQISNHWIPFLQSWGFCEIRDNGETIVLFDVIGRIRGEYNKFTHKKNWVDEGEELSS